ncbi:hypothetical protein A9Q89_02695 [Gammaproteobacteria bacterium 53_120_T64]|nr:hypothetical protein A9Q89_02695 [Gammaproteobacteria bacterium 53_120_T64]
MKKFTKNKFYLSCFSLAMAVGLGGCMSVQQKEMKQQLQKIKEQVNNIQQQVNQEQQELPYGGNKRTLGMFKVGYDQCYDRSIMPHTSVVDAHNHFQPFGGNAIPLVEMAEYLRKLGVLFVNVYGIGQTLPIDSGCEYYLDCKDTAVIPSIRNDFRNASNYLQYEPKGVHLTLSMSFPDLAVPEEIMPQINLLDREYPGQFTWMGEVNLVKQALFNNDVVATPIEIIDQWSDFMQRLREDEKTPRGNIPIAIHSDFGNNDEPEKYLPLMERVLELYPDNKIVWVHMGLSKELTNMDPKRHIEILTRLLDTYPHLMLDLSWRVLWDSYFYDEEIRRQYVAFINQYSTRFLPGTDFVALDKKDFDDYKDDVNVTGLINKYLDDKAFRNIALGKNYFDLLDLKDSNGFNYIAPKICE